MPRHWAALVLGTLVIAACGRTNTRNTGAQAVQEMDTPRTIDAVLAAHNDSLLAVPGVLGTAVGRCEGAPCIRILVSRVTEEVQRRIPSQLEGFPVRIDVTGPMRPR